VTALGMPAPAAAPRRPAALRSEVGDLAQTLWAARDRHELMDTVTEVEALKSALDALQLDVVRELEQTGAVKPLGWASTQDFVTSVAGAHHGQGRATVRLAERTAEPHFAPLSKAMADGWLSTAKAQVIERAIDALPGDPALRERGLATLLEEAKLLNATELKKVGRHLIRVIDPDGEDRAAERALEREERAAHLHRHLSITSDQAGGAWIRGRCSAEDAATLRSTLMPLASPLPTSTPVCDPATCVDPGCGHDGRDPRDRGARMLDALVEACQRLQTARVLPDEHGATARVSLLMDFDDLRATVGSATTETGEELSAGAVRRLCCDADVIPAVLGSAGEVLDVGRLQRLVTAALWKALVIRDRHCRFPGCTRPPLMSHAHHMQHWIDGGPTSLENLILLCGHHHRLVHAGPWQITRSTPGNFTFTPPSGISRVRIGGGRPPPRE
jgi:hypothetical protein